MVVGLDCLTAENVTEAPNTVTEIATEPVSYKQATMGEGIAISFTGFTLVFCVLIIIAMILSLLKLINKDEKKKEKISEAKAEVVADTKAEDSEEIVVEDSSVELSDDLELVAVITATIAASLNTSTDKLIVRSVRKLSSWNKETRHEQQKVNF